MQNLDKKNNMRQIFIVAIVVLAVFFAAQTFFDTNTKPNVDQTISEAVDQTVSETVNKPISQTDELNQQTVLATPQTTAQTIEQSKTQPEQQQCITRETFNFDPRHQVVAQYIKNDYLAGEIDYINYLNNTELEELARNFNVKAMYILGNNYLWNAVYEGDRAERFRPQEIEKQPIKARNEFNQQSFQKAQYWLTKAALYGQVSALIDISIGYQQQAYLVEEKDQNSEKNINSINQNAIAYIKLHQQLAPELSERLHIDSLAEQLGEPDSALIEQLQRRWKKEREDLGLSEQLELNLPPELQETNELRARLCP